jgi:hypothetical protein
MSKNPDQELQIQRLVDGQLSRPQMQQLLKAAERQPELWRELAVAFVEDRILAGEARRFASGLVQPDSLGEANAAANKLNGPSPTPRITPGWRSAGLWLSAAAMLLCSAGLGFLAGRGQPPVPSPAPGGNLVAEQVLPPGNVRPQPTAPYTFQLVDNQGQPIPNAALPLFTEETAAQLGYNPVRAAIPPQLQSEFRRAGYELEPEIKFIQGRMNDGRRVTFPYSDLKLRSYGQ